MPNLDASGSIIYEQVKADVDNTNIPFKELQSIGVYEVIRFQKYVKK